MISKLSPQELKELSDFHLKETPKWEYKEPINCPLHPTYRGINRPKSLQPGCLCPSIYIVRMYGLLCKTVNQQDAVKANLGRVPGK